MENQDENSKTIEKEKTNTEIFYQGML